MKTNQKTLAILVSVLIVSSLLSTIGGAYATETILSMPDDGLTITADSGNVTRMGAWVDEVIITAEPDPEQAVLKLGKGDIDLYTSRNIDGALIEDIAAHPEIDYALSHGDIRDLRFNTYRDPDTKAPFFRDGRLNPFAIPKIREAMNWLIDRERIVDGYLGGMGIPMWTLLTPGLSDHGFYYDIAEEIEAAYAYNFSAAKAVFDTQMPLMGAIWNDDEELWYYGAGPVEIIIVIRSDLPPFPEAGHYVADQLEALGFEVTRIVRAIEEAGTIWHGSEPGDGLFHIAMAGWVHLWLPRDWGYVFDPMYTHRVIGYVQLWAILEEQLEEFPALDEASWRLRFKDFTSLEERKALFSTALTQAMEFSNCIWVTQAQVPHAYRQDVALAADLASGILSQAWPHTAHFHDGGEPVAGGALSVALPSLLSGPWNPVDGAPGVGGWDLFPTVRALGDAGVLVDPRDGLVHPHRIESAVVTVSKQLPVRVSLPWVTLVEVSDPIPVPDDAWVDWDAENQVFVTAAQKKAADPSWHQAALTKSVVVYPSDIYDVPLHDGSRLSLGDFIMSMIMTFDRGKPESLLYDAFYEAELASVLETFMGVEVIHDGLGTEPLTIATYSDLWYLDAELNVTTWFPTYDKYDWTGFWHMVTVGWLAEAAGELAFSGGKASGLGVEWMDYTRGPSLSVLEYWMNWAAAEDFIPYEPTLGEYIDPSEIAERWANLQDWYAERGHFWVSNGPFYLHSVTEDPPEVILKRFDNYPDSSDRWLFLLSPVLTVTSTEGGSVVSAGVSDTLTITSTGGGSVISSAEGAFTFDAGTVVALVAEPEEGHQFVNWTGYVGTVADRNAASTTITVNDNYYVTANFVEIPSEEIPSTGCFIATAAYGTPMAEEIQILRDFRDGYLLTNSLGIALVDLYYRVSPPTARFIDDHPALKPIVRAALMPAVAMSSIVVNTSPAEKAALVGLVALVVGLVALVLVLVLFLSRKRRDRTLMGT